MEQHERSSSNDLSDAPSTDGESPLPQQHSDTIVASRQPLTSSTVSNLANIQKETVSASTSATRQENAPVKPKKPRKKKEIDPNAPPVEKKPRKPRAPAGTTANPRKKQKTENVVSTASVLQHTPAAQHLSQSTLVQPTQFSSHTSSINTEAAKTTQNGLSNPSSEMRSHPQSPTIPRFHQTEPPAPVRTRNVFDPVRGIERPEQTPPQNYSRPTPTPPRPPAQRTSASPAISSLINPPEQESTPLTFNSRPPTAHSNLYHDQPAQKAAARQPSPVRQSPPTVVVKKSTDKVMSETEGKPKKTREVPPPVPIGSGLLNSSFFGGEGPTEKPELGKGVSVILEIPLQRGENKVFNFAKLAEEKYGFAAVYPRQAANKERLARVAAAGAALERSASGSKRGETSVGESGEDDQSVDLDRDSDNDGDVNMTGVNGTNDNSGTDAPAPRKRRAKKDEYDADDPFVDDSEMLWEAQAVASRDGFFVYMGPLKPEIEAPAEKTDAMSKRGGKGSRRGGGPGSRGGRGAGTAGSGAARSGTSARGGGVRKPRLTKAEREQRDKEKEQREQAGAALSTKQPVAVA